MNEKYKQETPISARCYVCDQMFDGFIPCREHIIDEHRSGFDVSGENEYQYRSDLTFGDLGWVDENIWVLLREPDVGAKWNRLHWSYDRVFPFSRRTSRVERGVRHTVYVAQCAPIDDDWRHVYVGYTNKAVEARYAQHVDPISNPIRGRISKKTYLTKNLLSKDPQRGFRWDLQYLLHDHDEKSAYSTKEVALDVEAWLHQQLESIGYLVGGDKGRPFEIS